MIIPTSTVTPENYRMPGNNSYADGDSDSSDDSDDSDDDDSENNNQSQQSSSAANNNELKAFLDLESAMQKCIPNCIIENITANNERGTPNYARSIKDHIEQLIHNQSHARIAVVIDRRLQALSKESRAVANENILNMSDVAQDRLYIYRIPDENNNSGGGEISHDYWFVWRMFCIIFFKLMIYIISCNGRSLILDIYC